MMLWRIALAAAPIAQPVAPVIDPSTTSRECTLAFLLPIDACRTSSSILGVAGACSNRRDAWIADRRCSGGRPNGKAEDVVTGFINPNGEARGRPVGVAVDKTGALLITDDVGNTVWRVTSTRASERDPLSAQWRWPPGSEQAAC
jgi:hypothetical protein